MKVCMLAYAFYERDNRIRRYAEALAKRGDHVDAIALRSENQPEYEVISGVHVHRIQKRERNERGPVSYLCKLLAFLFRSAWSVSRHHLQSRYDLIHVHSVPDFEVFATLLPRLMGARVVLDIHDIVPEFYASKFKVPENSVVFRTLVLIERLSAKYASYVIIANHLWYDKLTQRSVRPEKCTAIINYPDPSIFRQRGDRRGNRGEFVMCYPGTLNWHQGVDRAIEAVALLRDRAPGLRLLIVGDGPDRELLKELVIAKRLQDRVRIQGSVPMEQVAEIMRNVDLGVVPKRKDSFGNEAFSTKIMEFMAVGVPVLASDTRIDKYYFHNDLLQFFESGSVEDLAAKILGLMNDQERLAALVANGTEFIRVNNWDVKSHEYLELVDRLVAPRAPLLCT